MDSNDKYLEYAKSHKETFINDIIQGKVPDGEKDAVFMAGSPGAGKTEVALGLAENYDNHVIIDADAFRSKFPDYNGKNSSDFQKASSWLVEQALKFVLEKGYSFILDATFAILSAEKNVIRAEKKGFRVTIIYVYQDPQIAWQFTKERERAEGRKVPKSTFINAYFKARENIKKVKERHPDIVLHIIVKDYQNNIAEVHYATDNVHLVLPERYTRQELEECLDD
ncbi:zeta toxin family protein [Streptococcus macacae]|uniref:UDP-N-acetylglucosamine kinase n=1 Tax=Streptococcus macacae NCTC 11558 TaxID=764298 RepID=G5JYY4_9STRE|nr:zeta toxin family protein [Streptococcus macacae]EHJ53103.1 zeta toxin [Streptococcus macacae NCTC 11558]SUN77183.1 zeta toxin family protein [Streptococcus macacae NCTC 11558]SUN78240.1 zeta toxin family protein [Streptococcus macacae NCTC 11558]